MPAAGDQLADDDLPCFIFGRRFEDRDSGVAQSMPEFSVMRHSRWKSATSMRTYIGEGSLLVDNAAAKLL